jgi:hypothetical protein
MPPNLAIAGILWSGAMSHVAFSQSRDMGDTPDHGRTILPQQSPRILLILLTGRD